MEFFRDYGDLIEELLKQPDALSILRVLLLYSVNTDDSLATEDFHKLAQTIDNHQAKEAVMTLAEKLIAEGKEQGLQQGLERALQQGLERGVESGKAVIVRSMLANGMAPEEIAKIADLSLQEVRDILETPPA